MKRKISAVVRDKSGKLKIVYDRKMIECGDDFEGRERFRKAQEKAGATMVTVWLDDDSHSQTWTKPKSE